MLLVEFKIIKQIILSVCKNFGAYPKYGMFWAMKAMMNQSNHEAIEFQRELSTNGSNHFFIEVAVSSCADCTILGAQPGVLLVDLY
nr:hypothetical protein CFP56_45419 [Quercus suber]